MDGRLFENSSRRPEAIGGSDPFYRYRRPTHHATPKVVQIPVRFVRSEEEVDRSVFASRIQKVYRGFRVRKCVKKIREMESEIEAVEERIKVMDLKDWKERVRMNETLMSVLLKLDSISGMDSGVRVLRKAVIRKAIALQERIDSLASVDSEVKGGEIAVDSEIALQGTEPASAVVARAAVCENAEEPMSCTETSMDDRHESSIDATVALDSEFNGGDVAPGIELGSAVLEHAAAISENGRGCVSCIEAAVEDYHESPIDATPAVDLEVTDDEIAPGTEPESAVISCNEASIIEDAIDHQESPMDATTPGTGNGSAGIIRENDDTTDHDESSMEDLDAKTREVSDSHREGGAAPTAEAGDVSVPDASEERESNDARELLLKRMAEENVKMLKMVEQLCERNEAQARMLNALSQRVGNLEKVVVCDWVQRRKKKKLSSGCENCA